MERLWSIFERWGRFFNGLAWVVFGGIGAFWWIPTFIGAEKPIPWQMGAICLGMMWVWVFNHAPRVGIKKFFRESKALKLELVALFCVSAIFVLGFAPAK